MPFISLRSLRLVGFCNLHETFAMANSDDTITMLIRFFNAEDEIVTIPATMVDVKLELGY